MCGIAGLIGCEGVGVDKRYLTPMEEALKHRGPDGRGESFGGRVGLVMRRLSIIDVAGGGQPLYNEDRSVEIVGNGEIYNYVEIKRELLKAGHKLRTGSDIEMVVHLYENYGEKCVDFLRGMFVLALYDKKKRRVLLIRDRMGEKPLYWTKTGEGIAFASEMKALLKAKGIKKTLNREAINDYFHFFYVPEPQTMFLGIKKLSPGTMLIIDLDSDKVEEKQYWNPGGILPKLEGDPTKKIREVFKESCLLTLRSDVPVGISLSGGIDSGAILAATAPFYKDRMKAFSIGYEGKPKSDERQMARKLAKRFKVEFIEKEISVKEVVNHFPRLVWDMDDPIADIAGHSIYSVSRLARDNKVPVLLGGLGGDELFWGYPWTGEAIKTTLSRINHRGWRDWWSRIMEGGEKNKMTFYQLNPGFNYTKQFTNKLFANRFRGSLGNAMADRYMDLEGEVTALGVAKKGLDLIRDVWLLSNCIALGDRLSMAASIELRSPFLDYRLVETVLTSKKAVLGFEKQPKYWLKKAVRGILPEEVLNRPKQGFTPPVSEWLKGILQKYISLLKGGFLTGEGIISTQGVRILSDTWLGLPMYWYAIYQIVLLEIWGREYYYQQEPEELR